MKKKLLIGVLLLTPVIAHSEILNSITKSDGRIRPIRNDAAVWFVCGKCGAFQDVISERFARHGIKVVSSLNESSTRILFAFKISVPQDNANKLMFAEEVYGKGLPPIPPAFNGKDKIMMPYSNAPIDAGHIQQGMRLTGSVAGGLVVGVLGKLFSDAMGERAADKERPPGVVQVAVKVADTVEKTGSSFTMLTVANTPETPDTLLEGAADAVIGLLINGTKDVESSKVSVDGGNQQ